jgi:hypothetical protein
MLAIVELMMSPVIDTDYNMTLDTKYVNDQISILYLLSTCT